MLKNPNFEQNKYSITSTGIYKLGFDSIPIMKWLIYFDSTFYENLNCFDLLGSICKYLSKR